MNKNKVKRNFFDKNHKSYYFSHDANSRNDEKILQLRIKFGWEGYGLYWAILESLRTANNYKLKHDFISGLAFELHIEVEKLNKIIKYCIEIDLLKSNDKLFWSNGLLNRMKKIDIAIGKMKAAGLRGAEIRYNKSYSKIEQNTNQNPVDERYNVVSIDE